MAGSSCLIVGFSLVTEFGCKMPISDCLFITHGFAGTSPFILSVLCVGVIILIGAGIHEKYTRRECLFPASMVQDATAGASTSLVRAFLS